jgi:hypothetical protein
MSIEERLKELRAMVLVLVILHARQMSTRLTESYCSL